MEENGIATVALTPMPEFHNAVGIPRSAAIAYPFGRPLGEVGDIAGQRNVLESALTMLTESTKPGAIKHLPFEWPEEPKKVKWHPPEISPIVKQNLALIKQLSA